MICLMGYNRVTLVLWTVGDVVVVSFVFALFAFLEGGFLWFFGSFC